MDGDSLRALQAPLKQQYREQPESAIVTLTAEGDLDFRGTLAVSKDAVVGFRAIRLRFDIASDATDDEIATLLRLTERYCVVFQTLAVPPALSATTVAG